LRFFGLFREDVLKIYQECCQLTGEEARKITLFNYDSVKEPAEVNAMKQKLREYFDTPEASTTILHFFFTIKTDNFVIFFVI
jgi:hypothetical protein